MEWSESLKNYIASYLRSIQDGAIAEPEAPIIETPVTSIVEAPIMEVTEPVIEVPAPIVEALANRYAPYLSGFYYTNKWHLASGIIVLATAGVGCYYSSDSLIKAGKWTLTAISFVLGLRPDMDGDGDGDGGAAGTTGATATQTPAATTQPTAGPSHTHAARMKWQFAKEHMAEIAAEAERARLAKEDEDFKNADIQIEDQRTGKGKERFLDSISLTKTPAPIDTNKASNSSLSESIPLPTAKWGDENLLLTPKGTPGLAMTPPATPGWANMFSQFKFKSTFHSINEDSIQDDASDTTIRPGNKTPTQVPMPDSRPDSPISPDSRPDSPVSQESPRTSGAEREYHPLNIDHRLMEEFKLKIAPGLNSLSQENFAKAIPDLDQLLASTLSEEKIQWYEEVTKPSISTQVIKESFYNKLAILNMSPADLNDIETEHFHIFAKYVDIYNVEKLDPDKQKVWQDVVGSTYFKK